MDFNQPHDPATDAAYNPQIVNEQGQSQEDLHHNGQSQNGMTDSPMEGVDSGSRYNSPNMAYQQQGGSRPGSGMSGPAAGNSYQGQGQQPPSKSSVVIKVGMVGDAQIGKTSLMVKYVEGSWDEDYIQTLGMSGMLQGTDRWLMIHHRRQLYGEDNFDSKH